MEPALIEATRWYNKEVHLSKDNNTSWREKNNIKTRTSLKKAYKRRHDAYTATHSLSSEMSRFGRTLYIIRAEWDVLRWLMVVKAQVSGVSMRPHHAQIEYNIQYNSIAV